jgi:hypothetical protein
VVINIIIIAVKYSRDAANNLRALLLIYPENIESIYGAIVTFILSFGSTVIERRQKIDIPDMLEVVIIVFIYCGLFLSLQFGLYNKFFWWDDLLHTISGVIIGFIGFIVVYKINYKYNMDINPLLIAIFSFTFAVSMGVIWEIFEFASDVIIGTAHQKWDLPDTEILMGKPYQGSGVRDTMSDLILDSIGALVASVITYYMYKKQKRQVLEEMQKMINE